MQVHQKSRPRLGNLAKTVLGPVCYHGLIISQKRCLFLKPYASLNHFAFALGIVSPLSYFARASRNHRSEKTAMMILETAIPATACNDQAEDGLDPQRLATGL